MKIAIIGGSFNPPHIGHLILAEEVLIEGHYDRVIFIPSYLPPHKIPQNDPGAEMRLAMLRASVHGHPEFIIDTCEMMRQGISYTVDTLQTISRGKDIEGKPGLVIGDDLASDFMESWKDADQILCVADLIIAHRLHAQELHLGFPHRYLDNTIISISSTLIRERIAHQRAWRWFVLPEVSELIESYGLYRNK